MAAAPGLRLPRSFYDRPVLTVAPDLLGRVVRHATPDGVVAVRLTEVEAYGGVGEDPGSHAHRGPTRRNAVMFDRPGSLYVYFTYGMHWCFNVVTGREGYPSAVLVRAGEPVDGLAHMRRRRGVRDDRLLASGPARLAEALGITRALDGHVLDATPLWLAAGWPVPASRRRRTPRIGISRARERRLRFLERDNPWISRP